MTDLPEEAVEAAAKAFRDYWIDGPGRTPEEAMEFTVQVAAPAIRHQRDEELRERLLSVGDGGGVIPAAEALGQAIHLEPDDEVAIACIVLRAALDSIFEEDDDD